MFDYKFVFENISLFSKEVKKRGFDISFDNFVNDFGRRKGLIKSVETLRGKRNSVSKSIPNMQKKGIDTTELKDEMRALSKEIGMLDTQLKKIEQRIEDFILRLPNITDSDVPEGGKENNIVIKEVGTPPEQDFIAKDHFELAERLNLVDYERGVKLGGSGFWIYWGQGALLEWALLNYFIDEHIKDGYTFLLPPHILLPECGVTAGQFPKFSDEVYHIAPEKNSTKTDLSSFILPTSETAIVNIYRDEILNENSLPVKLFAFSPCYRVEAGSHRTSERGTLRGHQFNKIEMFQFTTPDTSGAALKELVEKAERLVETLGLTYRTTLLAAKDASDLMAKTYDIEVLIPSVGYKEVSSVSNARAYQARRGNIRYKPSHGKRTDFVHTLNGSGLATSRLIPAILEQFQREDGSVVVPELLRKRLGCTVLG